MSEERYKHGIEGISRTARTTIIIYNKQQAIYLTNKIKISMRKRKNSGRSLEETI